MCPWHLFWREPTWYGHPVNALIVHWTKLLVSDWTRGAQLIPNCTLLEYLLCLFQNVFFYSLFGCQTLSFLSCVECTLECKWFPFYQIKSCLLWNMLTSARRSQQDSRATRSSAITNPFLQFCWVYYIYVIYRPGGPYREKLHSRPKAQFFPIRTDLGR